MSYYSSTTIAIHKDDYASIKKAIVSESSWLFKTTEEFMSALYFVDHPTSYRVAAFHEDYLILTWADYQWHRNPGPKALDDLLVDELVVTHDWDLIQIGEDGRVKKELSEHPCICTELVVRETDKEEL